MYHKVQKFSSGTGSPGWSLKKGRKTVVVWWWWYLALESQYNGSSALYTEEKEMIRSVSDVPWLGTLSFSETVSRTRTV